MQVNPKIDLTFAAAIRSFLRHDPDVIMVGEIRDQETASMAITASLTGHLVFSTIHTNDAAGAVTRLVDMGIEPFLVTSSLMGVLAQRLVRRLCIHCRETYKPTATELSRLAIPAEDFCRAVQSRNLHHQSAAAAAGSSVSGARRRLQRAVSVVIRDVRPFMSCSKSPMRCAS